MNENLSPFPEPEEEEETPSRSDETTEREHDRYRSDRYARRRRRRDGGRWNIGSWIGGAILIIIGLYLLADALNLNVSFLENWWAVFIFIPAAGAFARAWDRYRAANRKFTYGVSSALVGGLLLTMVALTFLINVNWSLIWPVFLIAIGLVALIGGFVAR